VKFAACNTGTVFLFLHAKNTAISSSLQKIESLVQYPVTHVLQKPLFLLLHVISGSTMTAEGSEGEIRRELDGEAQERDKQVSALLSDSVLRDLLIQKLAEGGHVTKQSSSPQQIGDNQGDNRGYN